MSARLTGLVAATFTPMQSDQAIDLDAIHVLTERLLAEGVGGLFVCGSTGEGVSMTTDERKQVAEAFISAARGRVPVIVHVGHNSLHDARSGPTRATGRRRFHLCRRPELLPHQ